MSLHIFYFFVLQGLHYRLGDEGSESPIDWSASGCKPNSAQETVSAQDGIAKKTAFLDSNDNANQPECNVRL